MAVAEGFSKEVNKSSLFQDYWRPSVHGWRVLSIRAFVALKLCLLLLLWDGMCIHKRGTPLVMVHFLGPGDMGMTSPRANEKGSIPRPGNRCPHIAHACGGYGLCLTFSNEMICFYFPCHKDEVSFCFMSPYWIQTSCSVCDTHVDVCVSTAWLWRCMLAQAPGSSTTRAAVLVQSAASPSFHASLVPITAALGSRPVRTGYSRFTVGSLQF